MMSFSGIKGRRLKFLTVFSVLAAIAPVCTEESEVMVRKKLDVICKDDLAAITDSIAGENLLGRPYYDVVFFQRYTEGKYSFKAIADYYFLKNVHVKVVRKYRYLASVGMWDRYSNEYVFLHDTATTVAPAH